MSRTSLALWSKWAVKPPKVLQKTGKERAHGFYGMSGVSRQAATTVFDTGHKAHVEGQQRSQNTYKERGITKGFVQEGEFPALPD